MLVACPFLILFVYVYVLEQSEDFKIFYLPLRKDSPSVMRVSASRVAYRHSDNFNKQLFPLFNIITCVTNGSRDSVVGIATSYGLDD
jgi:hypothetical protein